MNSACDPNLWAIISTLSTKLDQISTFSPSAISSLALFITASIFAPSPSALILFTRPGSRLKISSSQRVGFDKSLIKRRTAFLKLFTERISSNEEPSSRFLTKYSSKNNLNAGYGSTLITL